MMKSDPIREKIAYSQSATELMSRDYVNPAHRQKLEQAASDVAAKCNQHERVSVIQWIDPLLYLQVLDDRKEYPVNIRLLISFDLHSGVFYGYHSKWYHGLVRRGWGRFARAYFDRNLPYANEATD